MGGVAGYHGGRIDDALTYVARLVEAFPALVLIFLAVAIFNFNIYLVMVAVGVIWFPSVANAIRAKVLFFKAQQFIEASQELGLEDRQILWWDIVWHNVKPLLFTQISYGFARAILIEVTLSYLQMGVVGASWGHMLLEGMNAMLDHGASWVIFFPALAIVVAVVGFYLVGDAVNRMYQIKSVR